MRTSDWRVLYGCNCIVDVRPCSMWIWWQFHMSWAWTALFIKFYQHFFSISVFWCPVYVCSPCCLFHLGGRLPAAQWTIFCGSETDLWDRGCPGSLQLEFDLIHDYVSWWLFSGDSMIIQWCAGDGYPEAMQTAVLSWRLSDGAAKMDVDSAVDRGSMAR